jgi:hypothetical protein
MSRVTLEDNDLFAPTIRSGLKFGLAKVALAGNITLDVRSPPLQMLDTGGVARNITMPAPVKGLTFYFYNTSAGAFGLVIKKVDGSTTIGTVAQGKMAIVFSDGVDWYYAGLA